MLDAALPHDEVGRVYTPGKTDRAKGGTPMLSYYLIGNNSRMNGIGNYAQMNNVRLARALGNNLVRSVEKVPATGGLRSKLLEADSADFLKSYQNKMADLLGKANDLRTSNAQNVLKGMSATTSEPAKLEIKENAPLREAARYDVQVEQLASEQMNFTNGYDGQKNDPMEGELRISVGRRATPITIDVGAITGANNEEKLQKIADSVNRYSYSGVSAAVIENDGKKLLSLYSEETGKENAFQVSGSFAERTGLIEPEQQAQDARYTVTKTGASSTHPVTRKMQSSTNDVQLDGYKLGATLKETGSSTVKVGADTSKTVDAVQDLVDSYNGTLQLLKDNADRGPGVARQQRQMARSPISTQSMRSLGITSDSSGALRLDRSALTKTLESQPSLASRLLGGTNGLADAVYKNAQLGMSMPSSSLTGVGGISSLNASSLRSSEMSYMQNFATNGIYNRSGLLNLLGLNSAGVLMSFYG